jgi:nickel transport system substrate-binding protein
VLVRNERYWGRKPALQQITIKVIPDATSRAVAFETGEIDMLYGDEGLLPLDTFERFRHHPGYVARLSAPAETVMLALNASQGRPASRRFVRRSTTPSINRPSSIACCTAPSRLPTPCLPLGPLRAAGSDAAPLRSGKSPRPAGARLAAAGRPALATKSRATAGD